MNRFHLAYLTANDKRFAADYLHFRNMTRRSPGVQTVLLTIVVSRSRPVSAFDLASVERIVGCTRDCPWLDVRGVLWKGNLGRDFSSAAVALNDISGIVQESDYVMVRNRSAFGPLTENWYRQYVDQYNRHPATGLVGSTINLIGHPLRPDVEDTPHVQSYIYLSQWKHLGPMAKDYPGSRRADRLDVVVEGEIGLSRQIMADGQQISCLNWPEHAFSADGPVPSSLPRRDIKRMALRLPFRYKYGSYYFSRSSILGLIVWMLHLLKSSTVSRSGRHAPSRSVHDVPDYDLDAQA